MNPFYSKKAAGITPYTAGEQPRDKAYIKLNTNENPYPPSKGTEKALREFDADRLKLYPDPTAFALRGELAQSLGVRAENVFVGNGSDEVLAFAFKAFFNPDERDVAFADVTYSFYPVFCEADGIKYRTIAVNDRFEIDPRDYCDPTNCQGIVLANPNAPTSLALPLSEIERIVCANPDRVVIVDEAYIDFARTESAAGLVGKYKNLVVTRTFSKSYSLAGLRCGFAVADAGLIVALERIRDSFNSYPVDAVAQSVCLAAVRDTEYYQNAANCVIDTRERTAERLRQAGFTVLPSSANFLFISHEKLSAERAYTELKDRGILVRYFKKPRIENFLRITVGTPKQMQALTDSLANILIE